MDEDTIVRRNPWPASVRLTAFKEELTESWKKRMINKRVAEAKAAEECVMINGRVPVVLSIHFRSLVAIDTVNQGFEARLWIQFRWEVKGKKSAEEIKWKPKPYFQNMKDIKFLDDAGISVWYDQETDITLVHFRVRVHAVFSETFELQEFPFDFQELHVTFNLYDNPIQLVFSDGSPPVDIPYGLELLAGSSMIYPEGFVETASWTLDPTIRLEMDLTPASRNPHYSRFPVVTCTARVIRKSSFFCWTIVLPCALLVLLGFLAFWLDLTAITDRVGLILNLLLTLVALKFAVSSYTPVVCYLTYLDTYLVGSFVILCLMALASFVVEQVDHETSEGMATLLNRLSALITFGLYGALNLWMAYCGLLSYFRYKMPVLRRSVLIDSLGKTKVIPRGSQSSGIM